MLDAGVVAGAFLLPWRDAALLLGSWALLFLFARFFFTWWLFRDYEVKAVGSQLLFSASLTFSLSIFEVVLFEVTGVMAPASRQWVWRVDLIAMTYLIVLILPLSLFYAVAREYGLRRRRALLAALALLALYLYAFWRLGAVLEGDLPQQPVEGTPSSLCSHADICGSRRSLAHHSCVVAASRALLDPQLCQPCESAGRHLHGRPVGLRSRQLPVRVPVGLLAAHRRGGH